MLESTLEIQTVKLGRDHIRTLVTQSNLANAYRDAGRSDRSIALFERTVATQAVKLGIDHVDTLASQNYLANAYRDAGRLDRSIALLERTVATQTAKLGIDHPGTLATRFDLAGAYQARGDSARAESLLRDVLIARERKPGLQHPEAARTLSALARNLLTQAQVGRGRVAPPFGPADMGCETPRRLESVSTARSLLGGSLLGQEKFAEAEPLLLSAYDGMSASESRIPVSRRLALAEAGERIVQTLPDVG